eukprot:UC1_evm3s2046
MSNSIATSTAKVVLSDASANKPTGESFNDCDFVTRSLAADSLALASASASTLQQSASSDAQQQQQQQQLEITHQNQQHKQPLTKELTQCSPLTALPPIDSSALTTAASGGDDSVSAAQLPGMLQRRSQSSSSPSLSFPPVLEKPMLMYATLHRGLETEACREIVRVMCDGDSSAVLPTWYEYPGHIFWRTFTPARFRELHSVENVFLCPVAYLDGLPPGIDHAQRSSSSSSSSSSSITGQARKGRKDKQRNSNSYCSSGDDAGSTEKMATTAGLAQQQQQQQQQQHKVGVVADATAPDKLVGMRRVARHVVLEPAEAWEAALQQFYALCHITARGSQLRFRATCVRSGSGTKYMPSFEVAGSVGEELGNKYGWSVDLSKKCHLNVQVRLSSQLLYAGLPLTPERMTHRTGSVVSEGLRANVAWAMGSLARIEPGHIVMDPMCGRGALVTEAAAVWSEAVYLAADSSNSQVYRANANIAQAGLRNRVHLLRADATDLPLPAAFLDRVICDMPFGLKFGSLETVRALYPRALAELTRVLKVGGRAVLLVRLRHASFVRDLLCMSSSVEKEKESEAKRSKGKPAPGVVLGQWRELECRQVPLGACITACLTVQRC